MNKYKVLVVPHKTMIGTEIKKSLKWSKHFEIVEDTCTKTVFEEGFVEEVEEQAKHVDLVLAAHDEALYVLSVGSELVRKKLVTSGTDVVVTCRFKSETYNVLGNAGIKVPKVYSKSACYKPLPEHGFFIKPSNGQGTRDCHHLTSPLEGEIKDWPYSEKHLVLEYLPGKEYTVDCFSDIMGLQVVEARERVEITNGISTVTTCLNVNPDSKFVEIAEQIEEALTMSGAWFFQVKEDVNGELTLMEVAPRIAGSSGINRFNGFNFVELSLWQFLDPSKELSIAQQEFCKTYSRKEGIIEFGDKPIPKVLYVDLDDTLILGGTLCHQKGRMTGGVLNTELLNAITSLPKGYSLFILTKNPDPFKTLEEIGHWEVSTKFHAIYSIQVDEKKWEHMKHNSILIDDSHAQRFGVMYNKSSCFAFSPAEAVEVLCKLQ